MNKKIVLISCVSQKLDRPAPARDLYISTLFRLNLRYAQKLKPDEIFILSAKHGLLALDKVIDPYEVTLNDMSTSAIRSWADMVLKQLVEEVDPVNDHFVLLAGNNYRKFLIPHLRHYEVPLEGLRIGEQLGRLKELTA